MEGFIKSQATAHTTRHLMTTPFSYKPAII